MRTVLSARWEITTANLLPLNSALRHTAVVLMLLITQSLSAHPISIILCEALVHRDKMEVKIAVMPEDFLLVYGLSANGQSRIATDDIAKSAERHREFLRNGLVIRDADGNRLEGKIVKIEMPMLPAEGLLVADLMATTIVYRSEERRVGEEGRSRW